MLKNSISPRFQSTMSKPVKHNQSLIGQFNQASYQSPRNFLESEESQKGQEKCFGELIEEKDYSPPFYKPNFSMRKDIFTPPFFKSKLTSRNTQIIDDYDTDSIISGISDIKLIKSLSSSPSWSDDNDIEGCRRVQDELEQMDRVLRGIDPIPLNYDMDEYKQWMETFPELSLFGQSEYGPYKIWKPDEKNSPTSDEKFREKISSINRIPCANFQQYQKEIKKAVIHNIYENISKRLNNGSTPPRSSDVKLKRQPQIGDVNRTQAYLNECLRNSPFSEIVRGKYPKQGFLTRYNSREDEKRLSPSFESLPIMLENTNMKTSNKYKNDPLNSVNRKKSRRSIVLPPIENKWLLSSTQKRSISAIPTYSTLLSATTVKLDSKLLSGKSRNIPQY